MYYNMMHVDLIMITLTNDNNNDNYPIFKYKLFYSDKQIYLHSNKLYTMQ